MSVRSFTYLALTIAAVHAHDARAAPTSTCVFTSTPASSPFAAGSLEEKVLTGKIAAAAAGKARDAAVNDLYSYWSGSPPVHAVSVSKRERVAISLANPPTTRMRVSFDSPGGGHHEIEWDPAVASELSRVISLEGPATSATREWQVSVSVDPLPYSQSAGTVVVHTRFTRFSANGASDTASLAGTYSALVAAIGPGSQANLPTNSTDLTQWPAPVLSFHCDPPPMTIDDEQFVAATASAQAGGMRGFGVAPTFVTDTLSLLTEIAIDRAKAGAVQLLKKRLVAPFCGDDDNKAKLSLETLGLDSDEPALPRTCGVLESIRLEDLLSTGRPLLTALRDDVRFTIAPAAIKKLTTNETKRAALGLALNVLNTAIDHGGFDGLQGQLVLGMLGSLEKVGPQLSGPIVASINGAISSAFANLQALGAAEAAKVGAKCTTDLACVQLAATKLGVGCSSIADCQGKLVAAVKAKLATSVGSLSWLQDNVLDQVTPALVTAVHGNTTAKQLLGYGCQARLVVAVVKRCSRQSCAVSEITEMLAKPAEHFAPDTRMPGALCWSGSAYLTPSGEVEKVTELVLEGMRLAAPVVDGRGRERAKAAIQLFVMLVQRWEESAGASGSAYLTTFAELATALIDEDYGTALGRSVRLAEQFSTDAKVKGPVAKLATLIGSVATYATVYRATKDDDTNAARAARKEALSSIIDSATDRTGREGEWITSLGSNVGLSATFVSRDAPLDDGKFDPALRVPFGVSVEWLPTQTNPEIGFRFGLQIADLGQFVREGSDDKLDDDIAWSDFISPGVEVGALLGFLHPALNVSVHAAYAPSIKFADGDAKDGAWRYGISVGYYVPFFDLN